MTVFVHYDWTCWERQTTTKIPFSKWKILHCFHLGQTSGNSCLLDLLKFLEFLNKERNIYIYRARVCVVRASKAKQKPPQSVRNVFTDWARKPQQMTTNRTFILKQLRSETVLFWKINGEDINICKASARISGFNFVRCRSLNMAGSYGCFSTFVTSHASLNLTKSDINLRSNYGL